MVKPQVNLPIVNLASLGKVMEVISQGLSSLDFFRIPFKGFKGNVQELKEELLSLEVVGTSMVSQVQGWTCDGSGSISSQQVESQV